jgi:hypothetical protein
MSLHLPRYYVPSTLTVVLMPSCVLQGSVYCRVHTMTEGNTNTQIPRKLFLNIRKIQFEYVAKSVFSPSLTGEDCSLIRPEPPLPRYHAPSTLPDVLMPSRVLQGSVYCRVHIMTECKTNTQIPCKLLFVKYSPIFGFNVSREVSFPGLTGEDCSLI